MQEELISQKVDMFSYSIEEKQNKTGVVTSITTAHFNSKGIEKRAISIEERFIGYAFKWKSGSFKYSWDDKHYFAPLEIESHAKQKQETNHVSELYLDQANEQKVYIQGDNLEGFTIDLINPYKDTAEVASPVTDYSGAAYTKLPIISRAAWGADENLAFWPPGYSKEIKKIVVHHTVSANASDDYPAIVRSIFLYHAVTRAWGDIGYNFLIDGDGNIYEGRKGGGGVTGAHVLGHNYDSVGIGMIGSFTNTVPTADAILSLKKLVAEKSALHNIDLEWGTTFWGHRDFSATQCPGESLYARLPLTVNSTITYRQNNYADLEATVAATDLLFTSLTHEGEPAYADLVVTFDRPINTPASEILDLVPNYSSILNVTVNENVAYLSIRPYYLGGSLSHHRLKFLYNVLSLDSEVLDISLNSYTTQN